jgi:glycosyltransferase involved in cell wall biosynthesis
MQSEISGEVWIILDSRNLGGIESHVEILAKALCAAGQEVRVVFLQNYGHHPLGDRLTALDVPFEYLDGTISGLFKSLSRRPRLLHSHGYKAGVLCRLAGELKRIPVVSTYHAGEPGQGKVRLYNAIDHLTAPLSTAIAVSPEIQRRVFGRAELINNFVQMPAPKTRKPARTVAFVGRLSHEKGPDRFCEIATALPDISFEIYGDGPLRQDLQARYGDRVLFHGQVNGMSGHWQNIGLLCIPSRHEGLPYVALEAMAEGVPVAATDVGDLASLVKNGETGWLSPARDPMQLVQHIRDWDDLSSAEGSTIAAAARQSVQAAYSIEAVLPRIMAIYARAGGADNPAPATSATAVAKC